MRLRTGLLLLLILLCSLPAWGQNSVLTVGYVEFPPYQYRDAEGRPAGIFVDLTRKVAREAGYSIKFLYLPTARVYYYLENGGIDLWQGFADNPQVLGAVHESWSRPLRVEYGVWYRGETPEPEHFDDLKHHLLIRIAGYNYAGLSHFLDTSTNYRSTTTVNHDSAVEMLRRFRGDYVLGYREPMLESLRKNPVSDIRYTPMWVREAAWLFSVTAGDARRWRDDFDAAWDRLLERGEVPALPAVYKTMLMDGLPL